MSPKILVCYFGYALKDCSQSIIKARTEIGIQLTPNKYGDFAIFQHDRHYENSLFFKLTQ